MGAGGGGWGQIQQKQAPLSGLPKQTERPPPKPLAVLLYDHYGSKTRLLLIGVPARKRIAPPLYYFGIIGFNHATRNDGDIYFYTMTICPYKY